MKIRYKTVVGGFQLLVAALIFATARGFSFAGAVFILAGALMLTRPYAVFDESRSTLTFTALLGPHSTENDAFIEGGEIMLLRKGKKRKLPRAFAWFANARCAERYAGTPRRSRRGKNRKLPRRTVRRSGDSARLFPAAAPASVFPGLPRGRNDALIAVCEDVVPAEIRFRTRSYRGWRRFP